MAILNGTGGGFTLQQRSGAVMRPDSWTLLAGGNTSRQIAADLLTTVQGAAPDTATLSAAVASPTNDPQGNFRGTWPSPRATKPRSDW